MSLLKSFANCAARFMSRLLVAVLAGATIFLSMPASGDVLKFEFSGQSSSVFGPVAPLSGSFLFDTSAPTDVSFYPLKDGVSYATSFTVLGGITEFHAQLDGVWNLNSPVTPNSGFTAVNPSNSPGGYWVDWGIGNGTSSLTFQSVALGGITQQQWMESPDPVASFFLDRGEFRFDWSISPISDPNYSRGWVAGTSTAHVTPVPEPEIYALLGVGLGLLGWVGRRKKLRERAAV